MPCQKGKCSLVVEIQRKDGKDLSQKADLAVTGQKTTTIKKDRTYKDLAPGDYVVTITPHGKEEHAKIEPASPWSRKIEANERVTVPFELTPESRIQFKVVEDGSGATIQGITFTVIASDKPKKEQTPSRNAKKNVYELAELDPGITFKVQDLSCTDEEVRYEVVDVNSAALV